MFFSYLLTVLIFTAIALPRPVNAAELRAIAVLPADTFIGETASGHLIHPVNGVIPPFQKQAVQGFSDLLYYQQQWLAITDNGFGSKQNSADFLLRAPLLIDCVLWLYTRFRIKAYY